MLLKMVRLASLVFRRADRIHLLFLVIHFYDNIVSPLKFFKIIDIHAACFLLLYRFNLRYHE